MPPYHRIVSIATALLVGSIVVTAAKAETTPERTLNTICERTLTLFVDSNMNGVDWDALCARAQDRLANGEPLTMIAEELLAQLDTSHTRYLAPHDPNLAILASVFREAPHLKQVLASKGGAPLLRGAGFVTFKEGGRHFVEGVMDGSPAETAGLRVGDEIVNADGAEFRAVWPEDRLPQEFEADVTIRRSKGKAPETLTMRVTSADALVVLSKATERSFRIVERGGRRIGYLRGWTMVSRERTGGPRIALQRAISEGRLANIDAFVFDARGLVGGGGVDVLDLYYAPFNVTTSFKSRGEDWRKTPSLPDGTPLFIITGARTRSAAEIMAFVAQRKGRATLVGGKTAGAVTGGQLELLPDGGGLYVAVERFRIEGTELEGSGVTPDIETGSVRPFARGTDPAFEQALDLAARAD